MRQLHFAAEIFPAQEDYSTLGLYTSYTICFSSFPEAYSIHHIGKLKFVFLIIIICIQKACYSYAIATE